METCSHCGTVVKPTQMQLTAERLLKAVDLFEASWKVRRYMRKLEDCILEAAGSNGMHTHESLLITLLLCTDAWNDSQAWAMKVLGRELPMKRVNFKVGNHVKTR